MDQTPTMETLIYSSESVKQAQPIAAKVAVIIPCYNVEKSILEVVRSIPDYICNIVLVNDSSTDRTQEVIESLQSPRIKVVNLQKNQGVGGAMLKGYEVGVQLGATVMVKVDGDGQMDSSYIPSLIKPIILGRADYAKGNRFLHAKEIRSMPLIRRIGNIGLSFLAKLASGYWNIFDPTNGFTAISSAAINRIDFSKIAKRYFFETSLLVELGIRRAVVTDIYIPALYGNEKSHLSELHSAVEFPPLLLKAFLRRVMIQYFLRDFSAVSLFLVVGIISMLFGTLWGGGQWIASAVNHVPASTGTVMIAVLPIILGLQLLLQAVVLDIQNIPKEPLQSDDDSIPYIPK